MAPRQKTKGKTPTSLEPPTAEELVVKYQKKETPPIGGVPTVDQINQIRHLWGLEGLMRTEISKLVHVGLPVVNDATRGIPHGEPPGGRLNVQEMMRRMENPEEAPAAQRPPLSPTLSKPLPRVEVRDVMPERPPDSAEIVPESPSRPNISMVAPPNIPLQVGLSQGTIAELYVLAIERGCNTVDDLVKQHMIPWYGIKMRWERLLNQEITPSDWDKTMRKAFKLNRIADQLLQEVMTAE